MSIHPQQLRRLREQKGLTRDRLAELADLSVRQIARIETSARRHNARSKTLAALAKALEVEPSILSLNPDGDLQQALGSEGPEIQGATLRALRKKEGLKVHELADKSRVSARTIARLESRDTAQPVRAFTLERLSKALNVEPSVLRLSGDRPNVNWHFPKLATVNLKTSAQVALSFDLVSLRYGVSLEDQVCLAPMLFALLAEASLQWRRRELHRMNELSDAFYRAVQGTGYMLYAPDDSLQGMEEERESIDRQDLRGVTRKGECFEYDWGQINPFLEYLRMVAKDSGAEKVVDLSQVDADDSFQFYADEQVFARGYEVCTEELARITGNSKLALDALNCGDARLRDLPDELKGEEAREQRIAWLEHKLSKEVREGLQSQQDFKIWLQLRGRRHRLKRDQGREGLD